ncbi:hypothetical protein CTAYLR_000813 [Chrysophaeum taylorii]|uniref:RelA/SpoT domain-containing protein n=1 Tax=Chrysophaeum taylorii TaxID=2483200 RepID=A0AAD7UQY4_9STRA|nr:hypothetical protein CTAYLR_000813 [Chrysophaeum taylorii]
MGGASRPPPLIIVVAVLASANLLKRSVGFVHQRPPATRFVMVRGAGVVACEDAPAAALVRPATREGRWRVIAAWARWHRASLLRHLDESEQAALRETVGRAAREDDEVMLSARLEVAEVMLTLRADGDAVCAAFEAAGGARRNATDGVGALASEIRALRAVGLSLPLVATGERALAPLSSWQEMDETAATVRRAVAVATRDSRALVAELAAVVVALRAAARSSDATGKALALQAVHVHLPLAELLRLVETRSPGPPLFAPRKYAELLKEIEDRSYSVLFPETYALLRWDAARARALCANMDIFAARARRAIAETIADDRAAVASLLGSASRALADRDAVVADLEHVLVVTARVKTAASALRKMLRKSGVRDMIGLRVVVLSPDPCFDATTAIVREVVADASALELASVYSVYRAVRSLWPELEGRFKDYVLRPKQSGYQSLHTTVWFDELPMEVQIRTDRMHAIAESGQASHVLYSGTRRDAALASELLEAPLHSRRLLLPSYPRYDDRARLVEPDAGDAATSS